MAKARKISYTEPAGYFTKEMRRAFDAAEKKSNSKSGTAKKAAKKSK